MPERDEFDPDRYRFRGLHPGVYLGTASDRYAGWIGQIYSEESYTRRIAHRPKKVGGRTFKEAVLPVDSVTEYFEHFRVLEIDYTFYSLSWTGTGRPRGPGKHSQPIGNISPTAITSS